MKCSKISTKIGSLKYNILPVFIYEPVLPPLTLKLKNAGKKMEEAKKSEDPVKKIKTATELMKSIQDTSKEMKKLR